MCFKFFRLRIRVRGRFFRRMRIRFGAGFNAARKVSENMRIFCAEALEWAKKAPVFA